ncbi:MAG: DUF3617 domain-containing protein [Deltaproteobacteria bacterium]|nr:DUF3617 domain-containing protein [Deltaproteobacteria bacterium]
MKIGLGVIVLSLLTHLTAPVFAAETTGEWWEVNQKMEMPGMPDFAAMMPGNAPTKVCIAPGQDSQPFKSKEKDKDCTISDVKKSGNAVTFTMKCTGEHPMTGTGEITSTPTSFSQKIKIHSQDGDMMMVTNGKRIGGACNTTDETSKQTNNAEQKKMKADMDKGIAASNKAMAASAANLEKICAEGATSLDPKILELGGNYFDHGTGPNRVTAQCQNRQAAYCGQVRKIVGTPDGYRKHDEIRKGFAETADVAMAMYSVETVKECKIDPAPLLKNACNIAKTKVIWDFMTDYCPSDAAAYYKEYCAGYKEDRKAGWEERYEWCRGNENWQSKAMNQSGSTGNRGQASQPDQTQPPKEAATQEGVDALKNMFKF